MITRSSIELRKSQEEAELRTVAALSFEEDRIFEGEKKKQADLRRRKSQHFSLV